MIKYLLAALIITSSYNSCSQSKSKLLCTKWSLIKTVDPYQGGTENVRDSSNWKTIEFTTEGIYMENDPWNKAMGLWKFNSDESKLGLLETENNGQKFEKGDEVTDFRWQIFELSKDQIILGIQGRHGIVKHYYKKIP